MNKGRPSADKKGTCADAGISVLEVLVALTILALATTIAATMVHVPGASAAPSARTAFIEFVAGARQSVIRSGEAALLEIADGRATFGATSLSWNRGEMRVAGRGQSQSAPIRLVFFPDGTAAGSHVEIVASGVSEELPLVYRAPL